MKAKPNLDESVDTCISEYLARWAAADHMGADDLLREAIALKKMERAGGKLLEVLPTVDYFPVGSVRCLFDLECLLAHGTHPLRALSCDPIDRLCRPACRSIVDAPERARTVLQVLADLAEAFSVLGAVEMSKQALRSDLAGVDTAAAFVRYAKMVDAEAVWE